VLVATDVCYARHPVAMWSLVKLCLARKIPEDYVIVLDELAEVAEQVDL